MLNSYLIYKALHIISFISWMAALLYLPRLFVYHASCKKGSDASKMLKTMERKLLRFIMTPAMLSTFLFGILLILSDYDYYMKSGWLHAKLTFVLILSACHGYFAKTVRKFANDTNDKSEKFYRIINEVPTILMIVIVCLAVFKPF